ncbi:MAG: hypothetical protein HKM04_00505 [Legionellales bacterium]|nr:hypothetical protein [Legionellales bacterium]
MKKIACFFIVTSLVALAGCSSSTTLKAPCPNYGASCAKQPINSWDYKTV